MKADELAAAMQTAVPPMQTVQGAVASTPLPPMQTVPDAVKEGVKEVFADYLPKLLEEGRAKAVDAISDSLWQGPPDKFRWSLNSL